ncbi:endonuclease III domain-containing protein [Patescibacteria group bacterium]
MEVQKVYKCLLAKFGPQGWWPIFDITTKKCKYRTIGFPKADSHKFEICVGAILTQNTAWKNVEKALTNLCNSPLCKRGARGDFQGLTPKLILNSKNLEQLIQPAGYYNQKAKKLRIFSEWWQKSNPTKIKRPLNFCRIGLREELLSLWGIGPETADSMLLYAFNQPIFVIDTYTKRLCKELGIEFREYDEYREFFESQLPQDPKLFNEYHALIVAWGKAQSSK